MRERQTVIVERWFDEAPALQDFKRAKDAVAWCLEQHEVTFVRSYVSLDGRAMVCLYEAPDAESVRITQKTGGLPFTHAWAAIELRGADGIAAPPPGFSTVIVERDLPEGITLEYVRAMLAARDPCFDLYRAELLTSYITHDARRTVCVFSAPDAEAVRRANTQARHPFARAWAATLNEPQR